MENLNLLYNKTYYDEISSGEKGQINIPGVDGKNNRLTDMAIFDRSADYVPCTYARHTFRLYTIYPGLLVGTGYAHGVKNDDDVKIGFSFDYVTGLPYIPGSTVKGVLRSVFKHKDVIAEILSNHITLPDENRDAVITGFENDIFEDDEAAKDVFLDAVIFQGGRGGKILGFDNITPHDNAVKNPKPIKILKILPDVGFEFRFVLNDSEVEVGDKKVSLTAETKQNLFEELLLIFGIGAKTNVGYGNLRQETAEDNDASRQVVAHPQVSIPEAAPVVAEGKCKKCGKETKQKRDGTYWEYCTQCKNMIDAQKQKESRTFSLPNNPQNKNKKNNKHW